MTDEQAAWLTALFNSDPSKPDFYKAFPMYFEARLRLPVRTWWPPLSEVWAEGRRPPTTWPKGKSKHWAEAWAYLQQLHREYRAACDEKAGK